MAPSPMIELCDNSTGKINKEEGERMMSTQSLLQFLMCHMFKSKLKPLGLIVLRMLINFSATKKVIDKVSLQQVDRRIFLIPIPVQSTSSQHNRRGSEGRRSITDEPETVFFVPPIHKAVGCLMDGFGADQLISIHPTLPAISCLFRYWAASCETFHETNARCASLSKVL